jgi:hypothetical protein
MSFPPLSPEESTTPYIFEMAQRIGLTLSKRGITIGEMDAIAVAEALCGMVTCAHCGARTRDWEGGWASVEGQPVCHPNTSDRLDCYRLVTVYGQKLGSIREERSQEDR